MKRNFGYYLASVCVLAPLLWVILSVDLAEKKLGYVLLGGAIVTVGVVLWGLREAHRNGTFVPNHCQTCERPMRMIRPGELRPPSSHGTDALPSWRCTYCGRLA